MAISARAIACTALLSVWSSWSVAAEISLAPFDSDPTHAIVQVKGELLSGDGNVFRSRIGSLTRAIVSFDSLGGNLLAGLRDWQSDQTEVLWHRGPSPCSARR
jgi:hypothetical protein